MDWKFYALLAIVFTGFSDLFRKLGSDLKDPFFGSLIFQIGTFSTTLIMYLLFSRKVVNDPKGIGFAFIGGVLIAIFTTLSFKALSSGPGASVVLPTLRIGGIMLVVILGIFVLREKLTMSTVFGLLLSVVGIWFLFSSK